MPDALSAEVSQSLPWIACLLPLTLISAACAGALDSRELFLLVNLIQVVCDEILLQIAPVVMAVLVSPSLTVVIPTAVAAQALGAITVIVVVYYLEGAVLTSRHRLGRSKKLLGYGGWMTATNVVNLALASADQMIIGSVMGVDLGCALCGAHEPGFEERVHPLGVRAYVLSRASSLSGAAAYALSARALASMAYGFAAIRAPAIILSPTFSLLDRSYFAVISAPVAQILFPGMWMSGLSLVGFTLLQSQGRADLTGKLSMLEFLPFWILRGLTLTFGIVGAAAAWTLRRTVDALAIFWASGMRRKSFFLWRPRPCFWWSRWR